MPVERALSDLLASAAGGRRYFGHAENVSPGAGAYLIINRISGARDYAIDGHTGYTASRFQIDAYASSYGAARGAAAEAIAALEGFAGTAGETRILGIFVDGERDLSAADAGEAAHLFRRSVDVMVHHGE